MAATDVKLSPEHSPSSSASSPESTHGDISIGNAPQGCEGNGVVVQKRKGGRKPVYATQEERKMRNRAAQAAFRERRTEYIKHLEATIKHHEEALATLQQASRNATDELLMLRYKNSLLERILMEKQIDVHTELKAFTQGDPSSVGSVPSLPLHPPHVQRALNQRQAIQRTFHNQVLQQGQPPVPNQVSSPAVQPQAQSQAATRSGRRATAAQLVPDPQDSKQPPPVQPPRQQPTTSQSIHPPSSKRLRRTSDTSFVPKEGKSILPSPSTRGSSPIVSSPSITSPPFSTGNGNQHFMQPQVAPESSISSFYPSPYQAHMDKLDQEYDAEAFDAENGPDHMDTSPTSTHQPEYILAHRRHESTSAVSSAPAANGAVPAVAELVQKAGSPASAAEGSPNAFFNSNSWTVDLFPDPYIVGQYGNNNNSNNNNPFQAFPTSSMR